MCMCKNFMRISIDASVQNGMRLLVITHERAAIRMECVTGCFVGLLVRLLLSNDWGCGKKMVMTHHSSAQQQL